MSEAGQKPISEEDVTIFLVDDDRGMVSATSQWLSLSGLKVRAFADPTALMKVVRSGVRCVVISDIRMPGIDGMELLKLIKARDVRIPVILITGHGDIPLAVEAMKNGAFEFVPKPFSPEELLTIVKRAQHEVVNSVATQDAVVKLSIVSNLKSSEATAKPIVSSGLNDEMDRFERTLIEGALKRHGGSIPKVLDDLDIPRRTLNAKMKKHGIRRSTFRS